MPWKIKPTCGMAECRWHRIAAMGDDAVLQILYDTEFKRIINDTLADL